MSLVQNKNEPGTRYDDGHNHHQLKPLFEFRTDLHRAYVTTLASEHYFDAVNLT